MIEHSELLNKVKYDPETGFFYSNRNYRKLKIGMKIGSIDNRGYTRIKIDNKDYRGGRLAWFYMTGKWPIEIDHKDTNTANDKWDNLREATKQENTRNRNVKSNNRIGFKGVKLGRYGKFEASIKINNKYKYLGTFEKAEDAAKAYAEAAKEAYGEFARYSNV